MSGKHSFKLKTEDRKRDLPGKVIIGQQATETIAHVLLKMLAYIIFYRERLLLEPNLHRDDIPFVPDVAQLDYQLQPRLWVECGDCGVNKLDKLAVKAPEAEIWVVKRSLGAAQELFRAMERAELRRDRYQVLALDSEMFEELCGLVRVRNEILWVAGEFDPPNLQFDFNGLWFDAPFTVLRF